MERVKISMNFFFLIMLWRENFPLSFYMSGKIESSVLLKKKAVKVDLKLYGGRHQVSVVQLIKKKIHNLLQIHNKIMQL